MRNKLIVVVILIFIGLTDSSVLAREIVKIQSDRTDVKTLPTNLLLEALKRANIDYTEPYLDNRMVSEQRIMEDLTSGQLDIMWSMSSAQLESKFQAIYIPVYRGLLGMRLGIVKASEQDQFKNVRNKRDLQQFTAGQGKTWPDTQILEYNGVKVAKTLKYSNLFYMLEGGRFDYFPRGINEPWSEVTSYPQLNLVVEPHILIKYTSPVYFFVNKNNNKLQQTLTTAFNSMIADGTYEQMFFADEQVKSALTLAKVTERTIIELENPLLTDATPLDRAELWFDPISYLGEE